MMITFTYATAATMLLSLLLAPVVTATNTTSSVGNKICIDGYVMDRFCIQRGTLLDNPSVESLGPDGPSTHSLHCLIDIASCVTSEFEVLFPPNNVSDGKFRRGFVVDQQGQDDLVALAAAVGSNQGNCDNCENPNGIEKGFRAAIRGQIISLPTAAEPAGLLVEDTSFAKDAAGICDGFLDDGYEVVLDIDFLVSPTDASFRRLQLLHGSFMLIGWGLLLPMGAIFAKLLRHRPNGLFFKIHRGMQSLGLLCAIIGWSIALANFNVFGDRGEMNYNHGVMGMTVMIMGLLQPLNAFFRPHAPKEGETKERSRMYWEFLHKGTGYSALLLAIATIGIGTTLLGSKSDQRTFQWVYGLGVGLCLLVLTFLLSKDKEKYQEQGGGSGETTKEDEEKK